MLQIDSIFNTKNYLCIDLYLEEVYLYQKVCGFLFETFVHSQEAEMHTLAYHPGVLFSVVHVFLHVPNTRDRKDQWFSKHISTVIIGFKGKGHTHKHWKNATIPCICTKSRDQIFISKCAHIGERKWERWFPPVQDFIENLKRKITKWTVDTRTNNRD